MPWCTTERSCFTNTILRSHLQDTTGEVCWGWSHQLLARSQRILVNLIQIHFLSGWGKSAPGHSLLLRFLTTMPSWWSGVRNTKASVLKCWFSCNAFRLVGSVGPCSPKAWKRTALCFGAFGVFGVQRPKHSLVASFNIRVGYGACAPASRAGKIDNGNCRGISQSDPYRSR